MINRVSRGHSYFRARGEILGFLEDELLRKHLARMFSLISERKLGDRRRLQWPFWSSIAKLVQEVTHLGNIAKLLGPRDVNWNLGNPQPSPRVASYSRTQFTD